MDDFLMHYGISGMKWGVRRFQMKGSSKRTEAGKKRYAHSADCSKERTSSFGDRTFRLNVDFNNYSDEKTTKAQKKVYDSIKKKDFSDSLSHVRKYIIANNKDALMSFDSKDSKIANPFRYIKPKSIYIPKDQKSGISTYHVLCNYRFDPEHGIAITYENGKVKKVVSQDYVL